VIHGPDGWTVDRADEVQVNFSNGEQGNWAYAFSAPGFDPSGDAGLLISDNLEGLLPPENYTQLRVSDIAPIEPFGSVVSVAYMTYDAIWVDSQGSISIGGQIYAGIRQDGTALIVLVEHVPAQELFDDTVFEQLAVVVNETFGRFGGL